MLYGVLIVGAMTILVTAILVLRGRAAGGEGEILHLALAGMRGEEIPALADECIRVFRDSFGVALGYDDLDDGIARLQEIVRPENAEHISHAFAGSSHSDRYVPVVGSFLGELLRRHADLEWHTQPAAPVLRSTAGERGTASPFSAVYRNARGAAPEEGLRRWAIKATRLSSGTVAS